MRGTLGIAVAEVRSARRLVRTWLFAGLALATGLAHFLFFSFLHGTASGVSASAGLVSPRFLMSFLGMYYVWVLMVGLIFLAFDIRARDERDRIAEVLDSRPVSNLSLLAGRVTGLVIVAWIPVLVLAVLFQAIGGAAQLFEWWMGEMVQPVSLVVFVVLDALPVLILWCAVITLLAVALRYRILVVAVAGALFGLQVYAVDNGVIYLVEAILPFGTQYPSDILPAHPDLAMLANRGSILLLAAGALLLAAALYPRTDGARGSVRIGAGLACIAAGAALLGLLVKDAVDGLAITEQWAAAHESRRDDSYPGVDEITGSVRISPGEMLALDVELRLTAPDDRPLDELLFSFNPGMGVEVLTVGGEPVTFTHTEGLLAAALPGPLAAGSSTVMSLQAQGVPDPSFGYLDSAVDAARQRAGESGLPALGSETALFERSFVALTPGSSWLPRPGPNFDTDDPSRRPKDFFRADIEVMVPPGWLVAGPGRRQPVGDGLFRFQPAAPVPDLGLIASRFKRHGLQAAGVEFELLVNPRHLRNVDFFADSADALVLRLEELFVAAGNAGLGYPYGALSLVEVPARLRTYAGGWRMDTALAMPGIMLLREWGFPTARFDRQFGNPETLARMASAEGGVSAAKVRVLERFSANDISGGNPFLGVSRNFFAFQTGAAGVGAVALDFVCETLAERLLTDRNAFFSAHLFRHTNSMEQVMSSAITSAFSTGRSASVTREVLDRVTNRPSVWNRALGNALVDLDTEKDPEQAVYTLTLKGQATALSIWDALGRERTAALLSELRRRYAGANFTAEDFRALAQAVGSDIEPIIGDWLHDASLPGFLASPVEIFRLPDSEFGQPRYQICLHVRNDEPVPGLLRIDWRGKSKRPSGGTSAPIRIGPSTSREIGLVADMFPVDVTLQPYLSLNRQPVRLDLPEIDGENFVDTEPFEGSRPSDWQPSAHEGIVVDDLDPGFSEDGSAAKRIRDRDIRDVDEGLPSFLWSQVGSGWSRQELDGTWGKYRHTLARSTISTGASEAVTFSARLPHTGRWRLDYHLPPVKSRGRSGDSRLAVSIGSGGVDVSMGGFWTQGQGPYDMTLVAGTTERVIEFDGSAAVAGWNNLGEFELEAGEVRLVVTNRSEGQDNDGYTIAADAIRWLPVN
ncbi:MAG: hypothetical protein OXH52_04830 [Gammaproteobacteria bacterium]|nr:hypothetical protein [Gammaproteobacteria bacterium]